MEFASNGIEIKVNMEKLAEHFDMDASDMKMIQAQYINIGQEWVTIAAIRQVLQWKFALRLICRSSNVYRKRRSKVKTA